MAIQRYRVKCLAFGGLLLSLMTGTPLVARGASAYRPEVGRQHADFVLPRLGDRRPMSLGQFRGKRVLLVHFASW